MDGLSHSPFTAYQTATAASRTSSERRVGVRKSPEPQQSSDLASVLDRISDVKTAQPQAQISKQAVSDRERKNSNAQSDEAGKMVRTASKRRKAGIYKAPLKEPVVTKQTIDKLQNTSEAPTVEEKPVAPKEPEPEREAPKKPESEQVPITEQKVAEKEPMSEPPKAEEIQKPSEPPKKEIPETIDQAVYLTIRNELNSSVATSKTAQELLKTVFNGVSIQKFESKEINGIPTFQIVLGKEMKSKSIELGGGIECDVVLSKNITIKLTKDGNDTILDLTGCKANVGLSWPKVGIAIPKVIIDDDGNFKTPPEIKEKVPTKLSDKIPNSYAKSTIIAAWTRFISWK